MTETISIDPIAIIHTTIFKFILVYVFALQITASQSKDQTIFKNIFFRLVTNFIIFIILGFDVLESSALSLIVTGTAFFVVEK